MYSRCTSTYPWGPNCGSFRSMISHFRDTLTCTRSAKIGNAPNNPKLSLKLNSQKHSIYTTCLPPGVQIFLCFALRLAVSETLLFGWVNWRTDYCRHPIVRFTLRLAAFEIQHVQGQWKCTEWPQTKLEHLILVSFALRLAISEIHVQGQWKSKISVKSYFFFFFYIYLFIFFTMDPHGRNVSSDISRESTHWICSPKIHVFSWGVSFPKLLKNCDIWNFEFLKCLLFFLGRSPWWSDNGSYEMCDILKMAGC